MFSSLRNRSLRSTAITASTAVKPSTAADKPIPVADAAVAEVRATGEAREHSGADEHGANTAEPLPGNPDLADAAAGPLLVYDGGCPFCRHFAAWSELRGGIAGLRGRDGRADQELRHWLQQRGYRLADGAVLISDGQILHGAEAIQWICSRLQPSADLRRLLATLLAAPQSARRVYPWLLLARRLALAWRGLPVDPDWALPPR